MTLSARWAGFQTDPERFWPPLPPPSCPPSPLRKQAKAQGRDFPFWALTR